MRRIEASVVVAAFNEERSITACIESIFAAEPFAASFEVIVADGGSTDRTREILAQLATRHPELRVIDNPSRFMPIGINLAIKASRGDWIFILSAHSRYEPSYFRCCLETARRVGADNAGGRVVTVTRGDGFMSRLIRALGSSRFGIGASPFRREDVREGPADTAAYGCFPRRVFEEVGLYDERLTINQDWELNQRIRQSGGVVWLNPEIKAYYYPRDTLRGTLQRAWTVGKWNAFMWWVAPHSLTPRHAIPGFFVASLAIPGVGVVSLTAHQLVAVVVALVQSKRLRDVRLLPFLPAFFFSLHAAYGLGTFAGLLELVRGTAPVLAPATIEHLPPRAADAPHADVAAATGTRPC